MFGILQFLQHIIPQTFISLVLESIVGALLYLFLGLIFRASGEKEIYCFVLNRIKNIKN